METNKPRASIHVGADKKSFSAHGQRGRAQRLGRETLPVKECGDGEE